MVRRGLIAVEANLVCADGVSCIYRYLDAILAHLGSEAVMIPPTPHLTRYKREVAVKQVRACWRRGAVLLQARGLNLP